LITRHIVTRLADRDGVTAPVVERDYVLTHIVETLGLLPLPEGLVFKGGTALRLCFFQQFRYSADLDFSLVGVSEAQAVDVLGRAVAETADRIELPRLELVEGPPQEIRYEGPLGRERRIKLDFAANELVLNTQMSALIGRYEDQAPDVPRVRTYTLDEIAAEKMRCVIQRLQCRDPLDLHRLLVGEGIRSVDVWPLFEEKARHLQIDPDRFDERLESREPEYRRRWDSEIAEYAGDVPRFEETMRELRRALRTKGR
jgi:predicted nucleotidyltransferase component of viral defense system